MTSDGTASRSGSAGSRPDETAVRIEDESYDEVVKELFSIDEAEELALSYAGDGVE